MNSLAPIWLYINSILSMIGHHITNQVYTSIYLLNFEPDTRYHLIVETFLLSHFIQTLELKDFAYYVYEKFNTVPQSSF